MKLTLITLLVLQFSFANAQFLIKKTGFSQLDVDEINPAFLLQNKSKEMVFTYSSKLENQRIHSEGQKKIFQINPQGLICKQFNFKSKDTTKVFYYYKNNKIVIVRAFSRNEIKSIYYTFDSIGNKIKEVHCTETNLGESEDFFKLGKQQIDWMESYHYNALSAHQIKKSTYNDQGVLFKEAILYFNDSNQLKEENEKFVVTGVGQNIQYKYNQFGLLIEKVFASDVAGPMEEKTIFIYDNLKNLLSERFYRNDLEQHENIYFYNEISAEPEMVLTKYANKKTIAIKNIIIH
jgi:hypothetical protein